MISRVIIDLSHKASRRNPENFTKMNIKQQQKQRRVSAFVAIEKKRRFHCAQSVFKSIVTWRWYRVPFTVFLKISTLNSRLPAES